MGAKRNQLSPIHAGKSFCRDQFVLCFHQHCFPAAPLKHWYNKLHVWLWSSSSWVGRRSKGCAVCVPYFQIICENNKNIHPPLLFPDQAGWLTLLKRTAFLIGNTAQFLVMVNGEKLHLNHVSRR